MVCAYLCKSECVVAVGIPKVEQGARLDERAHDGEVTMEGGKAQRRRRLAPTARAADKVERFVVFIRPTACELCEARAHIAQSAFVGAVAEARR